jgi:predicted ribosome quality control (RQC) complex YloA/Tae2 family protein
MKQTFSNIDVYAIVRELDEILSQASISNIYEVKDLLILKVNNFDGNKNLIIKRDLRVNLTNYDYPIPKYPSQYVMSLRKFLKNRKIIRIHQYNFDRIIIIELSNQEGKPWRFIIELFSKGNYILVDENNIVKIAKRYIKLKDRNILANKKYEFPKSYGQNFLEINRDEFENLINTETEVVRILARKINISGVYSEEICERSNVNKASKGNELEKKELTNLYEAFKNLRNDLMFSEINAHIVYDNEGNQLSVLPFELKVYEDNKKKYFPSFNEAVDNYYSKIDSEQLIESKDTGFDRKIEAQKKILKNQTEYLETLKEDIEKYYRYGDFIYANFKSLEKLLNVIRDAKSKGYTWDEINEKLQKAKKKDMRGAKFFNRIIPTTQEIVLNINGDEVYLDFNKSIGENATMIYSRGKKARNKLKGTKDAIEKTKKKILKLEKEKESSEEEIDFLVKKPEKKWYEKYRWFKSSDGFLVIGGRDASSNEAIFSKYLEPYDIVFHTTFPGSPLVVIKNPERKDIPEKTLNEAADFVASYSQAWKENWGVVDVFYVDPDQVSKTPPSGEYLPKGSFMIQGKKNFIRNAKTELAIGLKLIKIESESKEYDHILYPKILAGPENPIIEQSEIYIKIFPYPNGLSKGNLAKEILSTFLKQTSKSIDKWVSLLSLDDIILMLPSGLSKINAPND